MFSPGSIYEPAANNAICALPPPWIYAAHGTLLILIQRNVEAEHERTVERAF